MSKKLTIESTETLTLTSDVQPHFKIQVVKFHRGVWEVHAAGAVIQSFRESIEFAGLIKDAWALARKLNGSG